MLTNFESAQVTELLNAIINLDAIVQSITGEHTSAIRVTPKQLAYLSMLCHEATNYDGLPAPEVLKIAGVEIVC